MIKQLSQEGARFIPTANHEKKHKLQRGAT